MRRGCPRRHRRWLALPFAITVCIHAGCPAPSRTAASRPPVHEVGRAGGPADRGVLGAIDPDGLSQATRRALAYLDDEGIDAADLTARAAEVEGLPLEAGPDRMVASAVAGVLYERAEHWEAAAERYSECAEISEPTATVRARLRSVCAARAMRAHRRRSRESPIAPLCMPPAPRSRDPNPDDASGVADVPATIVVEPHFTSPLRRSELERIVPAVRRALSARGIATRGALRRRASSCAATDPLERRATVRVRCDADALDGCLLEVAVDGPDPLARFDQAVSVVAGSEAEPGVLTGWVRATAHLEARAHPPAPLPDRTLQGATARIEHFTRFGAWEATEMDVVRALTGALGALGACRAESTRQHRASFIAVEERGRFTVERLDSGAPAPATQCLARALEHALAPLAGFGRRIAVVTALEGAPAPRSCGQRSEDDRLHLYEGWIESVDWSRCYDAEPTQSEVALMIAADGQVETVRAEPPSGCIESALRATRWPCPSHEGAVVTTRLELPRRP